MPPPPPPASSPATSARSSTAGLPDILILERSAQSGISPVRLCESFDARQRPLLVKRPGLLPRVDRWPEAWGGRQARSVVNMGLRPSSGGCLHLSKATGALHNVMALCRAPRAEGDRPHVPSSLCRAYLGCYKWYYGNIAHFDLVKVPERQSSELLLPCCALSACVHVLRQACPDHHRGTICTCWGRNRRSTPLALAPAPRAAGLARGGRNAARGRPFMERGPPAPRCALGGVVVLCSRAFLPAGQPLAPASSCTQH